MSVVVSVVRGPGRGLSYLFTTTTLSPDATTVPNWAHFRRSGCKLFAVRKMRAAAGGNKNDVHGCTEIDTLLQVATLGCLTDAVQIVGRSQSTGSMTTNDIGRRSGGVEGCTVGRFVEQPLLLDCHVKAVAISPGLCEGCLPCKIVSDSSLA